MTTLPPTLVRFRPQLQVAVRRHARRRRSQWRLASVAALAVVLGVVGVTVALVASEPAPASAIVRAQAALAGGDGDILHIVERTTLRGPSGATTSSRSETWQLGPDASDWRQISYDAAGLPGRELASAGGRPEVYNAFTNTIHTMRPDVVEPESRGIEADGRRLLDRMRHAIAEGSAREVGETTVGGRRAVRIAADDGSELLVDAETGRPLEWRSPVEGAGGDYDVATTRIETYEWLPGNAATRALLSLAAQHPRAVVVTDGTTEGTEGPRAGEVAGLA